MNNLFIFVFIVLSLGALALGFFVYKNPAKVIRLQQRFYACINWRMEPISMDKEIRNTKLMGLFLLVFTIFSCLYWWQQP